MVSFDAFLNAVTEEDNEEQELETFREYAIDLDTGEPLLKNGEIIILEENEALKVWIWKAIKTERYKYKAYSDSYGNEMHEEIGTVYNSSIKRQMLFSEIQDCLLVNPYVERVHSFDTELSEDGDLKISFSVDTIYGSITSEEMYIWT
jgi:hypothetical protein